jgi:putative acetyltransferase
MDIRTDDLRHPAVQALISEHLANMYANSPPESVHALDLESLRRPDITFLCAWDGDLLLGCGALKQLDARHGEIKSMRTPAALRRRGAGRHLLAYIVDLAKERGYCRLSLETGSQDEFIPARTLYESFGFTYCAPFADYREDPYSSFMCLHLDPWRHYLAASLQRR